MGGKARRLFSCQCMHGKEEWEDGLYFNIEKIHRRVGDWDEIKWLPRTPSNIEIEMNFQVWYLHCQVFDYLYRTQLDSASNKGSCVSIPSVFWFIQDQLPLTPTLARLSNATRLLWLPVLFHSFVNIQTVIVVVKREGDKERTLSTDARDPVNHKRFFRRRPTVEFQRNVSDSHLNCIL